MLRIASSAVALVLATVGYSSATPWQTLYFDDFESTAIGSEPVDVGAPAGGGVDVFTEGDSSILVVDADAAVPFAAQPIGGNAIRLDDTNTPTNTIASYQIDVAGPADADQFGILRTDFDVRRNSAASIFTPFRVILGAGNGNPLTFRQRPVEVRLKMAGSGVEVFYQNGPAVGGGTSNDGIGFFDGGANGNVIQDETISVSIVANSTLDPLTYDALNGLGSVTLQPKAYHVYTQGSGAPSVGILGAVPPSPHTLWGDDEGPYYFVDPSGDTIEFYDGPAELGSVSFVGMRDEGPFDYLFDNVSVSTYIPEPSSLVIAGLAVVAGIASRRKA